MSINIAIDGPSAAGKSTIAKRLAELLGYRYLDTGAMYRCVALKAKRQHYNLEDEKQIMEMLQHTIISFDSEQRVFLDGEDVSVAIRQKEISFLASTVSRLKEVRADMVARQQRIAASQGGIILEGRDIGSVVLPKAELKIYLSATPEIRARRRYDELIAKGESCDFAEILADVNRRDTQDQTRENSPLIKCDDAVEIDSSESSVAEISEQIYRLAIERGA